jgi:hypothetical protein
MSDLRDAFGRMIGTPPPLRGVEEILTEVRRSNRRRSGLTALGSGLAGSDPPPRLAGSAPTTYNPPTARAAPVHSRQMMSVLAEAVPEGYDIWALRRLGDDSTSAMTVGTPSQVALLAGAYTLLDRDGGRGELFAALISDGRAPPTGDLCAPANTASTMGGARWCQVVVVDGVPIQLTTARDPTAGQRDVATRFLWGGQLVVVAWQGVPASVLGQETTWSTSPVPMLAAPPLTATQLASLAADPALLQFP